MASIRGRATLAAALFISCLAQAAPAGAVGVVVGMGDQSPAMFSDPNWQALKLHRARCSDFPCDEHRAVKAVTQTFKVARTFDAELARLYLYNWTGNSCQGFDTGLTRADGSLREGYSSMRKQLPKFRR